MTDLPAYSRIQRSVPVRLEGHNEPTLCYMFGSARIEIVRAIPSARCLMSVSGYYEWQDLRSGKQPWYFTARDGSPVLTVAGLWDEWKNRETGERIKSCAMIICEPNEFVAEVHNRMPVPVEA